MLEFPNIGDNEEPSKRKNKSGGEIEKVVASLLPKEERLRLNMSFIASDNHKRDLQ